MPGIETSERAVEFLLAARMLTPRDAVDGTVRAESIVGRNRTVRVTVDGRGWILKQPHIDDPSAHAGSAREAAFYARVHGDHAWRALRPLVPEVVRDDRDDELLVIELVGDACNAHELDDAEGPTAYPRIGALLGSALAVLHAVPLDDEEGAASGSAPPWILDVAQPEPDWFRDVSPAQLDLIRVVQRDAPVAAVLDRMRAAWAGTALIHGDIKWGNVLVRTAAPAGPPRQVWLIDWESSSRGDPAWDVGSALHSFLADALHVAADEGESPPAVAAKFGEALPRIQREMEVFWRAYRDAAGARGEEPAAFLRRCTMACGARLLQSSYEWSHGNLTLPRDAAAALQLAVNILRDPGAAERTLLRLAGPA